MAVQTIPLKTEFHVAEAHQYEQTTPMRWIISHLGRYKLLLAAFFVGMTAANVFNASIPRQIGNAFGIVTGEAGLTEPFQAILTATLIIIGLSVGRFFCDALSSFSMEMVAKRLERDGRVQCRTGSMQPRPPRCHA